jgi:hypothetical protein
MALRRLAFAAVFVVCLAQNACLMNKGSLTEEPGCLTCGCADKARVCLHPTVKALAHDLDDLESLLERYGSIVAKVPDIWGQARLTKHREDFETQMAAELTTFTATLQGSLSRSDQAYLADAFAMSAAISGKQAGAAPPDRVVVANTNTPNTAAPTPLTPPGLPDQTDTFAAFSNITRSPIPPAMQLGFATAGKGGIQLEPTLYLDQKARYLQHLNELRRINEGDDTADSPGYALNLVRIPVSVLPGKATAVGHGAEVTMTLTPYLSPELLPTTFRNLVLNDLVDQIGFPLTQFMNNPDNGVYLTEQTVGDLDRLLDIVEHNSIEQLLRNHPALNELTQLRWTPRLQRLFARVEWSWVDDVLALAEAEKSRLAPGPEALPVPPRPMPAPGGVEEQQQERPKPPVDVRPGPTGPVFGEERTRQLAQFASSGQPSLLRERAEHGRTAQRRTMQVAIPIPATKSRRARLPFPPTEIADVYGLDFTFHMAVGASRVFAKERFAHPCPPDSTAFIVHLPDVQGYLQQELASAYNFLQTPCNADLWQFCTPDLAAAVHAYKAQELLVLREQFKVRVREKTGSESMMHSVTSALAWAILVESALLTEQLVKDMKEAAASKGCPCAHEGWLPYFLPNPPPEARQAFNDYVRCRWPIHVFALDPAAQQQNLADAFSGRREMQLAMSLAFVSGKINARNMLRYARRIEYDFATIDVNGTAIGFSHGEDTFGWRFYPRFQTPDIESNFTVISRDLILGGPNKDAFLNQRRLEPGMRECTAIVIMPSFVPYATLDVSTNWFKLAQPNHLLLDLVNPCSKVHASTHAVQLGERIKSIQNCACNVTDAACYRDGDLGRLLQKAKQLEARLPLQSMTVQVPYENTLGGFAMFNTGVTDLAPELIGWYGASSVNLKGSTTLFLVGNHFSVQQTRVIAGGVEVSAKELLSRQVMKVTIPSGATTVGDACQQFVDCHLATPYGVTQHLLIPVCAAATTAAASSGIAWDKDSFSVAFVYTGVGIAPAPATATPADTTDPSSQPAKLSFKRPADVPAANTTVQAVMKVSVAAGDVTVTVTGTYNSKTDSYEIANTDMAKALFQQFATVFGPEATNPPCMMAPTAALTFKSGTSTLGGDRKTKPLTITWVKGPMCCGKQ